jgi:ribonuclease Z
MKIHFIGTGSAVATAKRDNTSIYIETDKFNLLIDCPGSIIQKFSISGLDYTKLMGVFITHEHADHLYGIPSLIHSLAPFKISPKIYAPSGITQKVKNLLNIFKLKNKTAPIKADYSLEGYDDIQLFSTNHTANSKGIKIFAENKTVIYTSDTGPIEKSEELFRNADYLIHDCYAPIRFKEEISYLDNTHTSAETLGKIAESANVKNLIPIHFSGEHNFSMDEISDEIKKNYSGNLIIPSDFQSIII